eukprot:TRINITY_DN21968_c0_g1_i1.p1 TRINITY_DN21968_c0_g1~~TRINITY_DN21968_c0_g1_i1.p1  ORF type:complete len:168 (-),score=33.47 TRINITY_DN21968_c0_g1_i1:3-506(-)
MKSSVVNASNISLAAEEKLAPSLALLGNTGQFEIDIDKVEKKGWREPGADITDYFNYGLNEKTWRVYCERQLALKSEIESFSKIRVLDDSNEAPRRRTHGQVSAVHKSMAVRMLEDDDRHDDFRRRDRDHRESRRDRKSERADRLDSRDHRERDYDRDERRHKRSRY